MALTFADLLTLDLPHAPQPTLVASQQAVLLVLGAPASVAALSNSLVAAPGLKLAQTGGSIYFGYPILTAPFPILVGSLLTERNTQFDKLSLFSWVEENSIYEPRAEIMGLTPFGEQPVLFLRDLDLDRPVEAYLRSEPAGQWLRVAGVALADADYAGELRTLAGDSGALAALRQVLPADTQPFVEALAIDVARGDTLRAALRSRRRNSAEALMHVCDGWRILSHAATVVRVNPAGTADLAQSLRIDAPRKW